MSCRDLLIFFLRELGYEGVGFFTDGFYLGFVALLQGLNIPLIARLQLSCLLKVLLLDRVSSEFVRLENILQSLHMFLFLNTNLQAYLLPLFPESLIFLDEPLLSAYTFIRSFLDFLSGFSDRRLQTLALGL